MDNTLRIESLSAKEISLYIKEKPTLILPIAGLEPCGTLPIGIGTKIAELIAQEVSLKVKVLHAPALTYASSVPYSAFAGVAGVKSRTLMNTIVEACRCWYSQGIKNFIFLNTMYENNESVNEACSRLQSWKKDLTCKVLSLHHDPRVRKFITQKIGISEPARSEALIFALASCIDQETTHKISMQQKATNNSETLRIWRKKGRDPQQLIKRFPEALVNPDAQKAFDPVFGNELFRFILNNYEADVAPL